MSKRTIFPKWYGEAYKVIFRYDSQKNIIGIQKIDSILTIANEGGNHEQGSHNKN